MALPVERLGKVYAERREVIDPHRARAYAEATNDPNPAYRSGRWAPPVFGVVPTWEAMGLAVADMVPGDAMMSIVHGEQDMHFQRPLVPGRQLATRAQAYCIRVGPSGTRYTVRVTSTDGEDDGAVLEQYSTLFIRGMADGQDGGPDKPDHAFPERCRGASLGSVSVHVDDDQTFRYRDASGDQMPIHLDDAVARSVGLPGIIAHGLCTMAMCSQAVIALAAGGEPGRLARLAVRFSANVFPGNDVTTTVYDLGIAGEGPDPGQPGRAYAFEATSGPATVVTNGRAQVRP